MASLVHVSAQPWNLDLEVNVANFLADRKTTCWHCHATGPWRASAKPLVRQNATIHRLQCSRCGAEIVAKVVETRSDRDTRRRALVREHEALNELQSIYPQDSRFKVAAPICFLAEDSCAILVTRFYPGDTAAHCLRTRDPQRVAQLCWTAGAWLRRLHDCSPAKPAHGQLGVTDKLRYVRNNFGSAMSHDRVLRDGYAALERSATAVSSTELPFARQHGDCKPENILYDGTSMVGIDLQWEIVGAAVYDVAQFLDNAWLAALPVLRLCTAPGPYLKVEEAFLLGYGEAPGRSCLRWAQLYFALCYLGRSHQRRWPSRIYARGEVYPLAEWLIHQVTVSLQS